MGKKIVLESDYPKALARGLEVLRKGGVLVFPTDTVYGLGGDATKPDVLERIYSLKGRDRGKPFAVVMSGLEMMREWCEIPSDAVFALSELLPGPYTFIFRLKKGKKLAGQDERIGVRIPHHFFLRKLVLDFGTPVIATSANASGGKDPISMKEVGQKMLKAADLCIDGGETAEKQPSTVVDWVERKVLRKGAGKFEFGK
ncbi:MAG: L-threonylcarbamoyladenylate synthase [Candidatus ainarchaeum sp.]|nr:L-threonylcarbamoyladenylate synthase [Candidatus ainarchaeum sp.]